MASTNGPESPILTMRHKWEAERARDQRNGRQEHPMETRAQRRKGRGGGRRQMDACSYNDPSSESTG
eukprot:1186848-Heterocapsa_arctica.AAC.1